MKVELRKTFSSFCILYALVHITMRTPSSSRAESALTIGPEDTHIYSARICV